MNQLQQWKYECLAKDIVKVLSKKHFNAIYAQTPEEAKQMVIDMIEEGASVAVGGSMTIMDMGLIDEFRKPKYMFFERFNQPSFEAVVEVYRKSFLADFLVTSTNAITKDGELVNIDCTGNRVGGMMLGPNKVIIVAGANKIVDTIDDAIKRIKYIAPMNAKRIGHKTPCAKTGSCEDCDCDDRICNYTTIIHNGRKFKDRITIIIVPQELGL